MDHKEIEEQFQTSRLSEYMDLAIEQHNLIYIDGAKGTRVERSIKRKMNAIWNSFHLGTIGRVMNLMEQNSSARRDDPLLLDKLAAATNRSLGIVTDRTIRLIERRISGIQPPEEGEGNLDEDERIYFVHPRKPSPYYKGKGLNPQAFIGNAVKLAICATEDADGEVMWDYVWTQCTGFCEDGSGDELEGVLLEDACLLQDFRTGDSVGFKRDEIQDAVTDVLNNSPLMVFDHVRGVNAIVDLLEVHSPRQQCGQMQGSWVWHRMSAREKAHILQVYDHYTRKKQLVDPHTGMPVSLT